MGFLPKLNFYVYNRTHATKFDLLLLIIIIIIKHFGHNQILFTSIFILFLSHPEYIYYIYTFIYLFPVWQPTKQLFINNSQKYRANLFWVSFKICSVGQYKTNCSM